MDFYFMKQIIKAFGVLIFLSTSLFLIIDYYRNDKHPDSIILLLLILLSTIFCFDKKDN